MVEGQKTLTRMGGSVIAGLVDAGFEGYWAANPDTAPGTFPYVDTVWPLPPADDFLVLGISAVPLLLGAVMKNDLITNIGEGMICYSAPMIVHHTILRASWGPPAAGLRLAAIRASQEAGYPIAPGLSRSVRYAPEQRVVTAPKFIPGVLRPKYMHGS